MYPRAAKPWNNFDVFHCFSIQASDLLILQVARSCFSLLLFDTSVPMIIGLDTRLRSCNSLLVLAVCVPEKFYGYFPPTATGTQGLETGEHGDLSSNRCRSLAENACKCLSCVALDHLRFSECIVWKQS